MMSGNTDINTVIKTAIDGVQRGIGMDRTLTALVSEDRRSLKMRFCQGDGNEHWSKAFRFEIPPRKSILSECVQGNASFRYDAANPGALAKLIPVDLMRFCEGKDFVLAPMLVGTRSIGVFYADRAQSNAPITQEDFDSFSHFAQQLSMCLAAITKRKN